MNSVQVPELDHDAMMLTRFGTRVSPTGRRERRIVANLIAHLHHAGFVPVWVNDGAEEIAVPLSPDDLNATMKAPMELIFNLDEARVGFCRINGNYPAHWVFLVLGNDIDIVSDWNYFVDDRDGFAAAMDAFDAEQFA